MPSTRVLLFAGGLLNFVVLILGRNQKLVIINSGFICYELHVCDLYLFPPPLILELLRVDD